jgi:hypothetical protein
MDNNINFKDLWARQTTSQPNTDDLFLQINKLKTTNLRKLVVTNLLLIATSIFIIFIWAYYQPQLLTTKIGIILTIFAMIIYLFSYNQSFSLFKKTTNTQSNSEYLKDLLAMKTKQHFLQTTMMNLYFVLLSLGIGLYMYEYTSRMTTFWGIFAYGITTIWILFNWFYLRPKQIKKQQTKLDEIINKFEMLNKQLDE